MYRTHHCGELTIQSVSKNVTLAGWVQTIRKFGAITFVDLRDRYGITQLLMGEELQAQLDAAPLGREFVLQVKGTVIERSSKNHQIPKIKESLYNVSKMISKNKKRSEKIIKIEKNNI